MVRHVMNAPNQKPISIRDASVDDIPSLFDFLLPFSERREILSRSADELRTLVRHGFVAWHQEEIVGFAAIEVYSLKLAEIQALAVCPEYQKQGIGRELVRHCVERSKREGILELMAITASDRLFREVGFDYALPNQKRAFFYQTRPED